MYIYILTPLVAFAVAQGTKMLLYSRKRRLTWHDLVAYSGMPSGHTAFVTSITAVLALRLGLDSPLVGCSFAYAVIVVSDALGLRNYLGEHGKTLNVLVKDLKDDDFLDKRYAKQTEKIGHTPTQVLAGAIVGFIVAFAMHLLF
jgi:acid phosphatase family membrane protein YuiD